MGSSVEEIFTQYDQIRQGRTISRSRALVEAWDRGRISMGCNPEVDLGHVCSMDCRDYIDTICAQINLYGCRWSGVSHICESKPESCEVTYTDRDGYGFCIFSGRCIGKTIVNHDWRNPNANRVNGIVNYCPIADSTPREDSPKKDGGDIKEEENGHTPAWNESTPNEKLNLASPLRTPLATPIRCLTLALIDDEFESGLKMLNLASPFDVLGTVGGASLTGSGSTVAVTPRRATSSIGIHASLAKALPDYNKTTLKGQKRKSIRKRKASNPKRDVKRNDWAQDVKKRARKYLKSNVFFDGNPARNQPKSDWDEDDESEEEEDIDPTSDSYGGINLFTVPIPLYRGYSRDYILHNPFKKGRRSKYAWLGGGVDIKHNSEIETRTDNIIDDLLWDEKIKQQIYDQKLAESKAIALAEIETYVQNKVNREPIPLLPNYYVMMNRWLHALNFTVKEPILESVDLNRKAFYRLLTLTLWAFMWEYIEIPAWRKKCFERIKKLETSHVGVISPDHTNVPIQPGVSHIQFTTGLLYILRQDGIQLDKECVLPPDQWLHERLPSPLDLAFELNTVTAAVHGFRSVTPRVKKNVYKKNGVGGSRKKSVMMNKPASSRPTVGGIGGGYRRRKKRKKKKGKSAGYGRGKRSYTQSNVTEGRNYVKKGLLQLTRLGHAENIKAAIETCKQQSEELVSI